MPKETKSLNQLIGSQLVAITTAISGIEDTIGNLRAGNLGDFSLPVGFLTGISHELNRLQSINLPELRETTITVDVKKPAADLSVAQKECKRLNAELIKTRKIAERAKKHEEEFIQKAVLTACKLDAARMAAEHRCEMLALQAVKAIKAAQSADTKIDLPPSKRIKCNKE